MTESANSKTILRNTIWYGLENLISFAVSLITSVVIARTLGPVKMGYIIYVMWLVTIASSFGSIGIPAATRKYMAEFLAAGQPQTARWIYIRTLWLQIGMATIATLLCALWVLHDAPAEYRVASMLLILSIWPSMVNFISAQANVAAEAMSANLPASVAATVTFFVVTMSAVVFHWGVIGIASAMLSMRVVDFAVRFVPTFRRLMASGNNTQVLPDDLSARMFRFAVQSVASMLLTLVVWDRSEIFLLKHLSADIRQVAFYSVAFSLAEKLLVFPTVFASATGASVFAQYGRDRSRLPSMTAASMRYLGLTSLPLHLMATALAGSALLFMYGNAYQGAVLVATLAPITCLPKAFLTPVQTLFETVERQTYFLWATVGASVIDVAVAWWLIPRYGAIGATIGSGLAQSLAVIAMWSIAVRVYEVRLPWKFLFRIALSGLAGTAVAILFTRNLPLLPGLIGGAVGGVVTFFAGIWLLKVPEPEDLLRVKVLASSAPGVLALPANWAYNRLSQRIGIPEEPI